MEYDLEERCAVFGERVIKFLKTLSKQKLTEPLWLQLIRSATSIGANYMEANQASSKKDFRNKITICRKEASETKYWPRMILVVHNEREEEIKTFELKITNIMPSYQDFAKKARERFQQSQAQGEKKKPSGAYQMTRHAEYKMKQYGLSLQKVKGVIRSPKRIEKGIAGNNTIAVMQPVSPKKEEGKTQETWKQEIWVMYQKKGREEGSKIQNVLQKESVRIISAWRYPGVSPERNPIPSEILLELEDELD